ncbi:MAG: hypothetical protein HQL03_13605 [Nitrospirae bacterium]|nr:hypothetical protein [Nitrospirota bacterium]
MSYHLSTSTMNAIETSIVLNHHTFIYGKYGEAGDSVHAVTLCLYMSLQPLVRA